MEDPRTITGPDGKAYDFPADASDQEILGFFQKMPVTVDPASGAMQAITGPQNLSDDAPLEEGWKDWLNHALQSVVHPQTVGEFLNLLVPSAVGVCSRAPRVVSARLAQSATWRVISSKA